ncbi:MAG: response regulator transcription factor [Cyclobacteriaceae bacterium]
MIRIAIADDHPMIVNGLVESLQTKVEIVGTAENGDALLALIKSENPEIVLCDINMPGKSGFDVLEEIGRFSSQQPKVIVLSVHDEKPIIEKAFRIGAHGYLLKSSGADEVFEAIQKVSAGKKYFSEEVMSITLGVGTVVEDEFAKKSLLSEREVEITTLIVDGLSNTEIGEKLFISKRTVDAHRNNILQKLDLKNTAQLVKFALKSGLVN